MSNIEDLAKIQQALGSLQSNNPIDELTANRLIDEAKIDSAINSADLIRIGKIQADVSQVLGGESLNFSAVTRLSDCIKNIDDIIIDRLTKKLTSLLLANTNVATALATVSSVISLINTVNGYIAFVQALLDKSFLELLILAKEAGILERSEIFRQIQEKYGSTISNLNEILANIDNLNICTMMGLGGGPMPSGVKNMKPKALPDFGTIIEVDNSRIEKKEKYEDVISRIGFEITNVIDFIPNNLLAASDNISQTTTPVNSALSQLQNFSRAVVNRYGTASDDEVGRLRAIFNMEIDRKINEYAYEWSPETREFYRQKAETAVGIAETEYETLRDWNFVTSNPIKPGTLVAKRTVTYGPPGADRRTNFEVTSGILTLEEATSAGAYGKMISGLTCASNRFKGGTKLQLRKPDGTIHDPAGLNASGIVTVTDTGAWKDFAGKMLWDGIDIFVANKDDFDKYALTQEQVHVYLIEHGTKIGKRYRQAREWRKSQNLPID